LLGDYRNWTIDPRRGYIREWSIEVTLFIFTVILHVCIFVPGLWSYSYHLCPPQDNSATCPRWHKTLVRDFAKHTVRHCAFTVSSGIVKPSMVRTLALIWHLWIVITLAEWNACLPVSSYNGNITLELGVCVDWPNKMSL
jgi:hypothetical protein